MAIPIPSISLFLFLCFAAEVYSVASEPLDRTRSFIVHVSKSDKPSTFTSHGLWYSFVLPSLSTSAPHTSEILCTYERAVNGFSARLTASQAAELRKIPGVISVLPDELLQIHTTRTPHFLGLRESYGLCPNSDYADDVIIGVLDSGIWPEIPSFSDDGLSPVPAGWKGQCETAADFPASSCNRKISGARAYRKGYQSAVGREVDESYESKSLRDTEGHGTHTASIAAGSIVPNASFFGYGRGEARGMAVKARIAVYKVCWSTGCSQSDILAAMDDAISDGVHVISLSVGASKARKYYRDSIAIGSFGAVRHGVLVSCSAGNSSPRPNTAVNLAPWILTVGASTIDREFAADVILGNGSTSTVYHSIPVIHSEIRSYHWYTPATVGIGIVIRGSLIHQKSLEKLLYAIAEELREQRKVSP